MGKLTKLLQSRKIEIIVIIVFLLLSLRVTTWFEHPNILISGDYRPQLNQQAFTNRITYTWDQTDLGMPSVYTPRILVPSYLLMTIFNTLGANTYTSQISALFLMMFFSSTLMYLLTKKILEGNIFAALISGIFMTTNIYMINDREVTAIAFLDTAIAILPCLIMFTLGVTKKSFKLIALSGFMLILTYGSFPNYRNTIICIISIMIVLMFYFLKSGLKVSYNNTTNKKIFSAAIDIKAVYKGAKYIGTFFLAAFLASIWIIGILSNNLDVLTQTYGEMGTTSFAFEGINLHDTFRLITKWGFYGTSDGIPFVPYAKEYLQNPLIIILSYIPSILAFSAMFTSKSRKTTTFFSIIAIFFLALAAGLNPIFGSLYAALVSNIPLMMAFREAAQWSFLVVVAFSILIGITSAFLIKKARPNGLKMLIAGLIITILLVSTYPLTIGEVSKNTLNTDIKGSYFPDTYNEINTAIDSSSWTLLLPERLTYVTYMFNGTPLGAGNIYPLVFSKPIISGLGTEYMQSNFKEFIQKIYDYIGEKKSPSISSIGTPTASTYESNDKKPYYAIDMKHETRWASKTGMPQWYQIDWQQPQEVTEIRIFFENAYSTEYFIETWDGINWKTQIEMKNNNRLDVTHIFEEEIVTSKIRIKFTGATGFNQISIYEIEVYTTENSGPSKVLGMTNIKNIVVEKNIISGNLSSVDEISIVNKNEVGIEKLQDWEEATLYENKHALERVYTADTINTYTSTDDMFNQIKNTPWTTLQHTTYIHTNTTKNTNIPNNLQTPQTLTWQQNNPTKYTITTTTNNPFILALLETYNTNWKATINGNTIPEQNHIQINAYANAWIIQQTGQLTITLEYTTQNTFTTTIIASITLPILLITTLNIKQIKKTIKKQQKNQRKLIFIKTDYF
ncbi:MAG: discoidin domain-containing protein [Candidatus Bathyarchaeota archaeon]|nr:discoidin domain-containing protein [Candidatus Bathyarchaeota archaeon]